MTIIVCILQCSHAYINETYHTIISREYDSQYLGMAHKSCNNVLQTLTNKWFKCFL